MERHQGHSGKVGFEVPVWCHGGGGMHESGPQGRDLGTASADADGSCRGKWDALMGILVGEKQRGPRTDNCSTHSGREREAPAAPSPADALLPSPTLVSRKTTPHHYLLWWAPPSVLPQCSLTLPAPAHPVLYFRCRCACLGDCIPFPPELLKGPERKAPSTTRSGLRSSPRKQKAQQTPEQRQSPERLNPGASSEVEAKSRKSTQDGLQPSWPLPSASHLPLFFLMINARQCQALSPLTT